MVWLEKMCGARKRAPENDSDIGTPEMALFVVRETRKGAGTDGLHPESGKEAVVGRGLDSVTAMGTRVLARPGPSSQALGRTRSKCHACLARCLQEGFPQAAARGLGSCVPTRTALGQQNRQGIQGLSVACGTNKAHPSSSVFPCAGASVPPPLGRSAPKTRVEIVPEDTSPVAAQHTSSRRSKDRPPSFYTRGRRTTNTTSVARAGQVASAEQREVGLLCRSRQAKRFQIFIHGCQTTRNIFWCGPNTCCQPPPAQEGARLWQDLRGFAQSRGDRSQTIAAPATPPSQTQMA